MIMTRGWAGKHPWPIRLGAVAFGLALLAAFPSLASGGATPVALQVEDGGARGSGPETRGRRQLAPAPDDERAEDVSSPAPERRYLGEPVDLSIREGDLREVLEVFCQIGKIRLALDPAVQGTVTLELSNVPWDKALDQVLRINRLEMTKEGRVWYVHPSEAKEADVNKAPGTEQP